MEPEAAPPIKQHLNRFLRDHELFSFTVTLLVFCVATYLVAIHLPALIVGILLAYLLEGIVSRLIGWGCPRLLAISSTMLLSIVGISVLLLVALPKLAGQVQALARNIPSIESLKETFHDQPGWVTDYFEWEALVNDTTEWVRSGAETFVGSTLANVGGLFSLVVYVVLIPMLVFFLLNDKERIIAWVNRFVPNSSMIDGLKAQLDEQFGAYVRGKIIEALVIFALSFVAFLVLDVNYAFTLAVAIGLSVIIPYVGAIAVTFPVVILGLLQFGMSSEFWWLVGLYTAIQVFDGQVLVPLLFSEVVRIHPVAILVSILLFGALWGVWGVFFAIPLASLIKSVIIVVEKQLAAPA